MKPNKTTVASKTSTAGRDAAKIEKVASSRQSKQQTRGKPRISNACEACKRRKTKCTGSPSPCDVCVKAETYCCFNPRLDTRRKVAYTSTNVQDRQQFMISGLIQTIKHTSEGDLRQLLDLIRGPSRPDAVAKCLEKHFSTLQSKGLIPKMAFDSTDVVSFALQGLCGHRKGRPRPTTSKMEGKNYKLSPEFGKSSASDKATGSDASSDQLGDESNGEEGDIIEASELDVKSEVDFGAILPTESLERFAEQGSQLQEMGFDDFQYSHSAHSFPDRNGALRKHTREMPSSSRPIQTFEQLSHSSFNMDIPASYPMDSNMLHDNMQRYLYTQSMGSSLPDPNMMEYLYPMQSGPGQSVV